MPLSTATISSPWPVRVAWALALVCGWLCWPLPGQAKDTAFTVTITSTPPLAAIRPNHDLAHLTLTPFWNGQPLAQGHVKLVLTAPPVTTFLATGFPRVEGTTLLSLDTLLHDGTVTLQYVFPIRGAYTLALELTPVEGGPVFPPANLWQSIDISEDPSVAHNAWMLVAGLFILGGITGIILARSAVAQERPPGLSLLALLLGGGLLGGLYLGTAQAHHASTGAPVVSDHLIVSGAEGWALDIQVQPFPATVGQLVHCAVALRKDGEVFAGPMALTLIAVHQEEGHTVFETHLRTPQGQSTPAVQFYDGAPHTLTVSARPAADEWQHIPLLTANLPLEVIALHPPTGVKVRMMAMLLIVLVLGMLVGFFLPQRSRGWTDA